MAAELVIASVIVVAIAALIAILLSVLVVRRRATPMPPASPDEWLLVAPHDPGGGDPGRRTDPLTSATFRQRNESELAWRMRTAQHTQPGDPRAPRPFVPADVESVRLGATAASTADAPVEGTRSPSMAAALARTPTLAPEPPAARRTHRRAAVFVGGIVALIAAAIVVAIPTWSGGVLDTSATRFPALRGSPPIGVPGLIAGSVDGTLAPTSGHPASDAGAGRHASPDRGHGPWRHGRW